MTKVSPRSASELPDLILYQRAVDGDSLAFQTLARRYLPMMRAYALKLTKNPADADDALQDSLLQAWQKLDTLKDPHEFKSWIMTLTGRKCIDLMRKRKPSADIADFHHLPSEGLSPEDSAVGNSELALLTQALSQLPVDQQRIWLMREYGECSYQEIAQTLGVSTASVRGKLARARAKLIKELEGKN